MIRSLVRLLWMILGWSILVLLSLLLYPLAFLPKKNRPWYTSLFHLWCRLWVDALGVDLRLHQKNHRALPSQYILIANHPSAFEDKGTSATPATIGIEISLAISEFVNILLITSIAENKFHENPPCTQHLHPAAAHPPETGFC